MFYIGNDVFNTFIYKNVEDSNKFLVTFLFSTSGEVLFFYVGFEPTTLTLGG